MHALLYKDFRVMWKQMKAFLLLIAIFCLIPNQALNLSAFFVVYAGLILPMSLMSYERAKWDTFAAMLPYASREIVLSRYLGGWLCVALAGVLYAIGGALAAGQPFPPAERLVSLGWLFALTLAAQAILFPYLFRHGVEKARLYMMIFFVVLLALVAALAGLAGAALPQGSILFLLGAPAALVLALLLCLASVPLSVRQCWYQRHPRSRRRQPSIRWDRSRPTAGKLVLDKPSVLV